MAALILVGLLFVPLGLAIVIGGVVSAVRQSRQAAQRISAMGTVVDLVKRVLNPGSAGVYCPVVEFTTATNQTVRFESAFGTMPASHRVGQSIAVRYDQKDPQLAEVDSTTSQWLVPGCMIAMGLLFLVLGGTLLIIGIAVLANAS